MSCSKQKRPSIQLIDRGPEPLPGSLLHLCIHRSDGGLRYLDVWEDEESCERAFDERVHPAVDAAFGGARPAQEPTVERLDVLHATGSLVAAVERLDVLHATGSLVAAP